MAAPWVSGTVALMFAAAGRPLTIHEVRRALIGSVDPHAGPSGRSSTRLGYGYLNTAGAVALARQIGKEAPPPLPVPSRVMAPARELGTEDWDAAGDQPSEAADEDGELESPIVWEDVRDVLVELAAED